MNTGQLEERYFQRMDSALEDKLRVVEQLPEGTRLVADMGAGSGALSIAIAAHTGGHVYAVDSNPDSVSRIAVRASQAAVEASQLGLSEERRGTVTPVAGDFGFLAEEPAAGHYDAVVCSSVLHEAYSYGGGMTGTEADHRLAWSTAVLEAVHALREGGVLVVRDGVAPRDPMRRAVLVARTPEDAALVRHYLDALPQGSKRRLTPAPLRRDDSDAPTDTWEGSAIAVAEAVITLNWLDSPTEETPIDTVQLAREAHETYMLGTLEGYARRIQQLANEDGATLVLTNSTEYTQDGYVVHVAPRFGVYATPEDEPWNEQLEPWFPSTNAIWAFTKK